jgi:hypothetical protein
MAKRPETKEQGTGNKGVKDVPEKLAEHKTHEELNSHHQNARPKGKK